MKTLLTIMAALLISSQVMASLGEDVTGGICIKKQLGAIGDRSSTVAKGVQPIVDPVTGEIVISR